MANLTLERRPILILAPQPYGEALRQLALKMGHCPILPEPEFEDNYVRVWRNVEGINFWVVRNDDGTVDERLARTLARTSGTESVRRAWASWYPQFEAMGLLELHAHPPKSPFQEVKQALVVAPLVMPQEAPIEENMPKKPGSEFKADAQVVRHVYVEPIKIKAEDLQLGSVQMVLQETPRISWWQRIWHTISKLWS